MKRVANLRDVFGVFGIVAVTRVADEPIARADREHDLGEVWR
jgi:hypothetical protein